MFLLAFLKSRDWGHALFKIIIVANQVTHSQHLPREIQMIKEMAVKNIYKPLKTVQANGYMINSRRKTLKDDN